MVMSHSASNSGVSVVLNFVVMSFIMSEGQWMVVENVVFCGKLSIVTKWPVINMNFKYCRRFGCPHKKAVRVGQMCHCVSSLNQSIAAACLVL